MSEQAPGFTTAKSYEDVPRVKIEVNTGEPEKKEHAHPKRRRAAAAHTHHTNFHQGHPSESARAKHPQAETVTVPSTLNNEEAHVPDVMSPEHENEMRQISKLANLAMEPAAMESVVAEQVTPYELKDMSPEEDPEVLSIEAEFVEPEVAVEAEVATSEHIPFVGDPAQLNGEDVLIKNVYADLNGVRVFSVTKTDGSEVIVTAEQLVFIDSEKEKELRAERLKELFDEYSGFLKGIFQIAYIAHRMANPKDRTIRRGLDTGATYEAQSAVQEANRLSLIAGTQSVSLDDMRKLGNVRASESLFGTSVPVEVAPVEQIPAPAESPLAVSIKALG